VSSSSVGEAPPVLTPESGQIAGVMIQGFEQPRPTTRIVVTFRQEQPYSVHVEGHALKVRVGEVAGRKLTAPSSEKPDRAPATATALVEDVNFEERGAAQEVTIALSARTEYRTLKPSPTLTRLTLEGVRVPSDLERTLDMRAFDGALETVSSYRSGAPQVTFDAQHRAGVKSHVSLKGTTLVWAFYEGAIPSTVSGVAADGKAARRTKSVAAETPLFDDASASSSSLVESQAFEQTASFVTPVLGQPQN